MQVPYEYRRSQTLAKQVCSLGIDAMTYFFTSFHKWRLAFQHKFNAGEKIFNAAGSRYERKFFFEKNFQPRQFNARKALESPFNVRRTHNALVSVATNLRFNRCYNLRAGFDFRSGRRRKRHLSAYVYISAIRVRLYYGVQRNHRKMRRLRRRKRHKTIVCGTNLSRRYNFGYTYFNIDIHSAVATWTN